MIHEKYPMVSLITYVIGLHDPYGVLHSERVAKMCLRIGQVLGMNEADLEILELSGCLHDLGKLAIPETTRAKPGPLTEAETFMMQQHPALGLKILERMNGSISPRVRQAIYHHHEDYGGTGYPEHLQGDAIPLEARIIRIADTYDALTHARGYRMPMPSQTAVQLMVYEQNKHRLFDPTLFSIFLKLME